MLREGEGMPARAKLRRLDRLAEKGGRVRAGLFPLSRAAGAQPGGGAPVSPGSPRTLPPRHRTQSFRHLGAFPARAPLRRNEAAMARSASLREGFGVRPRTPRG